MDEAEEQDKLMANQADERITKHPHVTYKPLSRRCKKLMNRNEMLAGAPD